MRILKLIASAIFLYGCSSSNSQTEVVVENKELDSMQSVSDNIDKESVIEDTISEIEWPADSLASDIADTIFPQNTKMISEFVELPLEIDDSPIKILTAGVFHSDEISEDAPNMKWIGLFKSDTSTYLKEIAVQFERVKDVVLDKEDEKTAWKISTDNADRCLLLISGLELVEGSLQTVHLENKSPLPTDTLLLKADNIHSTMVINGDSDGAVVSNYRMLIHRSQGDSTVEQSIVAKKSFDDQMINIIWAGDLDRDGEMDFIIDTARHYNATIPSLFLSSKAKGRSLVECVAIHRALGC